MIWKIVFTVIVIAAVWFGYRMLTRMGGNPTGYIGRAGGGALNDDASEKSEDMEQCAVCESYVPRINAQSCGQDDCPYPAQA